MTWLLAAKAAIGKVPAWIKWLFAAALLLGAFAIALRAYGNARYDAGVEAEKAAWEAADARLRAKAEAAGSQASEREKERQRARDAIVEDEREKIRDAVENGTSPFDAMPGFNAAVGGGVR